MAVIQWNCRSIRKQLNSLNTLVHIVKPIAICLQETWLLDATNIQNIKETFDKYNLYFKNRTTPNGGVGLMILKTIPQVPTNLNTHLEAIAFNINIK